MWLAVEDWGGLGPFGGSAAGSMMRRDSMGSIRSSRVAESGVLDDYPPEVRCPEMHGSWLQTYLQQIQQSVLLGLSCNMLVKRFSGGQRMLLRVPGHAVQPCGCAAVTDHSTMPTAHVPEGWQKHTLQQSTCWAVMQLASLCSSTLPAASGTSSAHESQLDTELQDADAPQASHRQWCHCKAYLAGLKLGSKTPGLQLIRSPELKDRGHCCLQDPALLRLAAHQAARDEEVQAARRQVAELEAELGDAQRTLDLQNEQSAALKEVRACVSMLRGTESGDVGTFAEMLRCLSGWRNADLRRFPERGRAGAPLC